MVVISIGFVEWGKVGYISEVLGKRDGQPWWWIKWSNWWIPGVENQEYGIFWCLVMMDKDFSPLSTPLPPPPSPLLPSFPLVLLSLLLVEVPDWKSCMLCAPFLMGPRGQGGQTLVTVLVYNLYHLVNVDFEHRYDLVTNHHHQLLGKFFYDDCLKIFAIILTSLWSWYWCPLIIFSCRSWDFPGHWYEWFSIVFWKFGVSSYETLDLIESSDSASLLWYCAAVKGALPCYC